METSAPRIKPRLARTLSGGRWDEYRGFLRTARELGYRVVALEEWVRESQQDRADPTLILRHDVDQHPRSALTMAAIEEGLGVRDLELRDRHLTEINRFRDR